MSNHLSSLGIFHTAISVIAILIAFVALLQEGKINPANKAGKLYVLLTIIACITALPIMKTGHPSAGHVLAILILILLPLSIYANSIRIFGNKAEYVKVIVMSATLFFSLIPATVETLTRLPVGHPIASGPDAPVAKMGLMILMLLFVAGVAYQIFKIRASRKSLTY